MDHGRVATARRLIDEAWALLGEQAEHYWEAELKRLEAVLRGAEGAAAADVERLLQDALAVADSQRAAAFVVRAAAAKAALTPAPPA